MTHPETGRPLTLASRGIVTSPHSLASAAGVATLRGGGSAVDAAITASAVLSVVYPHMTSVGGDAFWLLYDAARREVRFLNAAGRAPAAATIEAYRARGLTEIPHRGWLSVANAPGLVAGWVMAHQAYGRRPLVELLTPAVEYARDGFPVTARLTRWIARTQDVLAAVPETAAIFLPAGMPPQPGQRLRVPDLARTLETIGAAGRAGFYEGAVAQEIARASRAGGGFLDAADLAATRAEWGTPLRGTYRGVTLYETPPPTQGFAALLMLGIVADDDLARLGSQSADYVHLLVEAKKVAFADRNRYLADPDAASVPTARLTDPAYARQRRTLIRADRAQAWDQVPAGSLAGDTVYLAAVDGEGNAVSLIQSLYFGFGSGVVAGRTGVLLQNRGAYFSLEPAHPNALAPGKQPAHTLMASLAFEGDRLRWVFGCMGADGQPQIHVQVYSALIDFGLDLQQAIEAPRWLAGRFVLGDPRERLNLESRFPEATIADLEARGHHVTRWEPWAELAGHAHGIEVQPGTGTRMGAADPRSDGAAIG
ncbi:MAG TPA: gamma-glutamyltransferase, partial [Methylomirabilota bacterium]|nr:gamma-glutamyltransferase [Methylomirabilota bacterium]